MKKIKLYLSGSLRNPDIPRIANELRKMEFDVFDDWFAAGPHADDAWRDYEKERQNSYQQALHGLAAEHIFSFDFKHLEACEIFVLYLPAGKSSHIELGYAIGKGKKGYIILDSPDRWDVMYKFATNVFCSIEEFRSVLVGDLTGL